MTTTHETRLLFRPTDSQWGYLPEGPVSLGPGRFSWITIQTSPSSEQGALHCFDYGAGNTTYPLPGRPGFAFPTASEHQFLIGLERSVVLFDTDTGKLETLADNIDSHTTGTIINDAVVFSEGLVFGGKDLEFKQHKSGLYFLRRRDRRLFQLRRDQLCSNGKFIRPLAGDRYELFDIDTPTQKVMRYELNVATGELSAGSVALDVAAVTGFPDGMIQVPGRDEVIIAMFNPEPASVGYALRFALGSDAILEAWEVQASPQVTCPQLVENQGETRLVLTTAAENMSPERLAEHPNAGCLFDGPIAVESIGDQPRVDW